MTTTLPPCTLIDGRYEVESLIGVESEHVVRCEDFGVDPSLGLPWLTVELLHGNTLKGECSRSGALPSDEALGWLREAASGVAAAQAPARSPPLARA